MARETARMIKIVDGPTTLETMKLGCVFSADKLGWFRVEKEGITKVERVTYVKQGDPQKGEPAEIVEIDPELVEVSGLGKFDRGGECFSFSDMLYNLVTREGYIDGDNFVKMPAPG